MLYCNPIMTMKLRCLVLGACLALSQMGLADTLHPARDGAYWHHDSGWVFPERIGPFVRIGIPQDVAGSIDIIAYYAREDGPRITAVVDVYAADSAQNDATLAQAKASFSSELHGASVRAESQMKGHESSIYPVARVNFQAGTEALRTAHALYFASARAWLVKVRVALPSDDPELVEVTDTFVRDLRWDSLGQEAP